MHAVQGDINGACPQGEEKMLKSSVCEMRSAPPAATPGSQRGLALGGATANVCTGEYNSEKNVS